MHLLHLLRKDATHLRAPLAVWLALLLLRPLLGVSIISLHDLAPSALAALARADQILQGLHLLGAWALALWLVQLDPLLRPRHYLLTRPVSRPALLVSKLLGAFLLLGLLPALALVPWWLFAGLDAATLARFVALHATLHFALVLPALLVASLVDSLRRAALWSFVLLFVAATAPFLYLSAFESVDTPSRDALADLRVSRYLLAAALALLGTFALLVWQHLRRPTPLVVTGAVALLAATTAVLAHAPWNLLPASRAWTELNPHLARDLTVAFSAAERGTRPSWIKTRPKDTHPYLDLAWQLRSSPDLTLITTRAHHRFTTPANHSAPAFEFTDFQPFTYSAAYFDSIRRQLTPPNLSPALAPRTSLRGLRQAHLYPTPDLAPDETALISNPQDFLLKPFDALPSPSRLEATFRLHLREPRLLHSVPAAPGPRHRIAGLAYQLHPFGAPPQIQPRDHSLLLAYAAPHPAYLPPNLLRALGPDRHHYDRYLHDPDETHFLIFDPLHQEFIAATDDVRPRHSPPHVIAGIALHRSTLRFRPPYEYRDGRRQPRPATEAWRAHLRLALVHHPEIARITRTVVVEDFTARPAPAAAPAK